MSMREAGKSKKRGNTFPNSLPEKPCPAEKD